MVKFKKDDCILTDKEDVGYFISYVESENKFLVKLQNGNLELVDKVNTYPPQNTPFIPKKGEKYYTIRSNGKVDSFLFTMCEPDMDRVQSFNSFCDQDEALLMASRQNLLREIHFYAKTGGNWVIENHNETLLPVYTHKKLIGTLSFISEQEAEKVIELFGYRLNLL